MQYFLGVDIGTTSTKAVAFSELGKPIAREAIPYGMLHPKTGWAEQDPYAILKAVIQSVNAICSTFAPTQPAFVSFSAAMHSIMAVDEEGNPLTNCIIWGDNRSVEIAERLKDTITGVDFYHRTGVPIHAMTPLCKLLWFKQNQPTLFKSAYKFIGIKEFIFSKIFNEYIIDTSVASATGLLNIKTLKWDDVILDYISLNTSQLSKVVSPKHIVYLKNNQSFSHISQTTPFITGASDGALSNLGTNAKDNSELTVTIGTSGAARLIVDKPETDAEMRTFCYHLKDEKYIIGGAINNGAIVLQWLKEKLLQTNETYEQLFNKAATVSAGSNGLIFLPYLLGERAPIWNASAKGNFFGFSIHHTKADLIRASIEGVIFSLYDIGKILVQEREIESIHASGGFARSKLWLQILADVFNLPVKVSGAIESSAFGAVKLGIEALDKDCSFDDHILSSYEPDAQNHLIYKKCFEKYNRIYHLLKEEMNNSENY